MPSITSTLTFVASFFTVVLAAGFEGTLKDNAQIGNYKYLGCANEINGRALNGLSYSDDKMTIESCQAFCLKNQSPLSGVEYGRECYCGRKIVWPSLVGQQGCNMPCKGNNKQFCGGNSRISVFNQTNWQGPMAPKKVGNTNWTYQACYMEPQNGRALDTLIKADDKMTVEMCVQACGNAKYPFAGLEYGRECWCGATPWPDLKDAKDPGCAMTCDMTCGGNDMQICGGRGAITLYKNVSGKKRGLPEEEADVNVLRARKGRFFKVVRQPAEADKAQQE